jgi:hypothetical protein
MRGPISHEDVMTDFSVSDKLPGRPFAVSFIIAVNSNAQAAINLAEP